ncbi:MAG: type II toxin-antitoxin system HicA family toxin [Candidatus Tectimicrobiota bacterium]
MTILPLLSGREVVQVFVNLGWEVARQRGSHIILVKAGHPATLSVPDHREVSRGTLRALIRRAGLTPEEFLTGRK